MSPSLRIVSILTLVHCMANSAAYLNIGGNDINPWRVAREVSAPDTDAVTTVVSSDTSDDQPTSDVTDVPIENSTTIAPTVEPNVKSDNSSIELHKNWPHDTMADCGHSVTDRIVGGQDASLGQYPWMALLGIRCELQ